jgi:hypothetical protein
LNIVGNRRVIREEPELIDSDRKELETFYSASIERGCQIICTMP